LDLSERTYDRKRGRLIMMTKMAIGEINRVGVWALRGAGYPLGVADRAVHLLSWTEAISGSALAMLRMHETLIAESALLPACTRSFDATLGWTLRAGGKSLLEVGPPLVDLTWCGQTAGVGHAAVFDVFDAHLVPVLAHMAIRESYGAIAVVASSRSDINSRAMSAKSPTHWVALFTGDSQILAVGGDLDGASTSLPESLLGSVFDADETSRRNLRRDIEISRSQDGRRDGYLGLSLLRQHAICFADFKTLLQPLGLRAANWTAQYAKALRFGVDVATEDYLNLYALERRAWAPTSERSRKQAAF